MLAALPDRTDSYAQLITVLLLFVFVLAVTAVVTRWIGGYQKGKTAGANMELVEALRLSNNKYVQIIRIGRKYLAVAVCKDTVTMLSEIPEEDISFSEGSTDGAFSFKEVLSKIQTESSKKDNIKKDSIEERILEKEDGRNE